MCRFFWLILAHFFKFQNCCKWPNVDALFVIDSTEFVTSFQHQDQISFIRQLNASLRDEPRRIMLRCVRKIVSQVTQNMKSTKSNIAIAQFTPSAMVGMTFENFTNVDNGIQNLRYSPCENCEKTSINSLARISMLGANRKEVPDVILVVSNSYQPLVEVLSNEALISPASPLHVFYIVIGSNMKISRFEPSAHTVGMKVTDFQYLPHLLNPLCESVNGYIKGHSSTRFGSLCWIIIGVLILFALIILGTLAYAIHAYHEENRRLKFKLSESERLLRKQNEYFTSQLHSQMEKQIANGEKYAEEMKKQHELMQSQLDRQLEVAYQQGTKMHQIVAAPTNCVHPNGETGTPDLGGGEEKTMVENRRDSGIASPREDEKAEDDRESAEESRSTTTSSTNSTTEEELNRKTHLPRDHPARKLPPIDLMFLVDTSSSIGINNFDIQKNLICDVLKDVDIAPGRSRIAMVQYAQDPSVVFGFDQYYSFESVRKGVMRLSYTGGATMLSKALAFAGGIMYHEQNLKKTHRKHKYLPTPKHDRPQIMCLVSDGYSDDNADKESILLHDRLYVKIFAVVTKAFNKDKLVPITRFEGSVFTIHQRESIAIWLWRQQRIWAEHYSSFIEKERKL